MRTGNNEIIHALLQRGALTVDVRSGDVFSMRKNGRKGKARLPIGVEDRNGYLQSGINFKGLRFWLRLHRVVFISAHGIPAEGMEIDHVNGCRMDNRIINLEAVTRTENMRRVVARRAAKRKAAC